MTIDEAITHAREVAKRNRADYKNCPADRKDIEHQTCEECAKEHEQLAERLEELKAYREIGTVEECRNSVLDIQKTYNKAIDDFVNACKEDVLFQCFGLHINGIERIAKQLKAGGENENYNKEES